MMRIENGSRSWTWEMRPPRVLIAEKDDSTRATLVKALRADGYDTVEARDGDEVLDSVLAFPPGPMDCIDVIVASGRCDGSQVLGKLRGMQIGTPFVVVTETSATQSATVTRRQSEQVVDCSADVKEICGAVFKLTHAF